MDCPVCGGAGCDECEGEGRWELTGCPLEFVGEDVWELLDFAELYKKGCPPVAGGSLDQTHWFNEAARFVWREESYWRAKLGIPW